MTPQEKLAAHIKARPQSPGYLPSYHPDHIAYHKALSAWVAKKAKLEAAVTVHGMETKPLNPNTRSCTTRADYIYIDHPTRKQR